MITVITPTISGREEMLEQCIASVAGQTIPVQHLVLLDEDREGGAQTLNKLVKLADTEWILPLADDDILYPTCAERLYANSEGADMIYPWCNVVGREKHPAWNPNSHFDAVRLRSGNYIPATVLIKTEVVKELGYYPEVVCEDHAMWIKLLDAGKVIRCVPEILWEYRFSQNEGHKNVSDGYDPKEV